MIVKLAVLPLVVAIKAAVALAITVTEARRVYARSQRDKRIARILTADERSINSDFADLVADLELDSIVNPSAEEA